MSNVPILAYANVGAARPWRTRIPAQCLQEAGLGAVNGGVHDGSKLDWQSERTEVLQKLVTYAYSVRLREPLQETCAASVVVYVP